MLKRELGQVFTKEEQVKEMINLILALVPKNDNIDLNDWIEKLNNIDWKALGFLVGGRLIFSQKSLSLLRI